MEKTLEDRVEQLHKICEAQHKAREIIRASKRYIQLQEQIIKLTESLEAQMSGVDDSIAEYEEAKKALMLEMQSSGVDRLGKFVAHYRVTNTVNGSRLFTVLGNDVGLLMEMAKIQQKKLKDFAKGNPDIKDELLACIEETGKTIDDITYLEQ